MEEVDERGSYTVVVVVVGAWLALLNQGVQVLMELS
jgi:hypothetical protein